MTINNYSQKTGVFEKTVTGLKNDVNQLRKDKNDIASNLRLMYTLMVQYGDMSVVDAGDLNHFKNKCKEKQSMLENEKVYSCKLEKEIESLETQMYWMEDRIANSNGGAYKFLDRISKKRRGKFKQLHIRKLDDFTAMEDSFSRRSVKSISRSRESGHFGVFKKKYPNYDSFHKYKYDGNDAFRIIVSFQGNKVHILDVMSHKEYDLAVRNK